MQLNNATSLQAVLEQLSTERLDQMLHKELQKDPVDDHAVKLILRLLREREKNCPTDMTPEMEQAWVKYQSESAFIEKRAGKSKPGSLILRVATIAAVLCLVVLIFPQQAGAETIWQRLFRWTESIVEFFTPNDNTGRMQDYVFETDNPGLQQVYDAVVEMGVTDPVVPMWLPEGYELVECQTLTSPRRNSIHARFFDGKNEAVLEINVHLEEKAHSFLKDDSQCTEFEQNGFIFYFASNNERYVAIWTKDNIECFLTIDCQGEILQDILRTIYVTEDMK